MSAIDFLFSLDSKIIKYGLERTMQLLDICNNPQHQLQSIQIVGTNGKGSTASMLSNVLIKNGYKVGLYTSPHLVIINERIRVNNRLISNCFMDDFIIKYKKELELIKPSFFEILTVMALKYFVYQKVDFAILETGLGGRLDSVTAAQSDTLVYTPIAMDHMSILGNTLNSIAQEKAGAISNNNSFIFSAIQKPIVTQALNIRAKTLKKTIFYNTSMFKKNDFCSTHQAQNASLAHFVLNHLSKPYQLKLSPFTIKQYLQEAFWPGRIQFIQKNPDIIFDVAHNEHGLQAFIKYFKKIAYKYHLKYLIIGFEEGKQIEKSIKQLYHIFDNIIITDTQIRKSMSTQVLYGYHNTNYQSNIIIDNNPIKSIKKTILNQKKDDVVVILGSHYFGPHISEIFKNAFDMQ